MKMGRTMRNKQGNDRENHRIAAASGGLALAAAAGLPHMLGLKGNTLAVSNSWFSVLAFGMFWLLCFYAVGGVWQERQKAGKAGKGKEMRRRLAAAAVWASLFSFGIAFGAQLDREENVNFRDGAMWLSALAWAAMLTFWVYYGWMRLEKRGRTGQGNRLRKWDALPGKTRAAVTVCFFLLCWLPVYLAVYPGFFVYDAQDELVQVQTRQFTTHHPLPHVLLLGGVIQAVHKLTGSYNAGIGAYTLLQMLFMAAVFAYVLEYMKKSGVSGWMRVCGALYFAFFPVNVMFVLCSAKDGIFSGALLILLTALTELGKRPEAFFASREKMAVFGGSALVMMSFRHNGMYAFLVLVPVMLLFYGRGFRRRLAALLGTVFGVYFLLSAGLARAVGAQESGSQEMLTVPIQQLARVWYYEGDNLSGEQKKNLYEILPEEVLPYYTAKVSDGVKRWFDNEAFSADPGKYIGLWAEVGRQHPFTYINAWFMTSYGFWYPDTVIDVYRGNGMFTFTYEDSSFFGYEVEQPGERAGKIPWLEEWYRKMSLEIAQQKIPVLSMLFSPGFLFWVFAFAGGYAYYKRERGLLLPFAMLLLVWLTVILGPTYLPRYVLILWFALPGALAVLVNNG